MVISRLQLLTILTAEFNFDLTEDRGHRHRNIEWREASDSQ